MSELKLRPLKGIDHQLKSADESMRSARAGSTDTTCLCDSGRSMLRPRGDLAVVKYLPGAYFYG